MASPSSPSTLQVLAIDVAGLDNQDVDHADAQRRYYDAQAARYDTYASGDGWTANLYLADVLAEVAAGGFEVRTALDLGAGTGQSLEVVRATFPAAQLWAVDVSPAMLEHAMRKVPSAYFEVADLPTYVARDAQQFDLLTCVGCLELIPELPSVLPTVLDRVRPGGYAALTFEPAMGSYGGDTDSSESSAADRTRFYWTVAEIVRSMPGAELVSSRLFRAYERVTGPVLNELLLFRRAD